MLRSRLRRRQLTFEMPLVAASVECLRVQVAVLLQFSAPPGWSQELRAAQVNLFRLKGHATNRRLKGIRLKGIRLKGIRIQSLCHASIGRRRKGKTADVNLTPATAACGA